MFRREAWRLLAGSFHVVLAEPDHLKARAEMQLGACLAGLAIENSMLGAAHALANPLTARYGMVHGQAIAVMLPHVVRFNSLACDGDYAVLLATHGDGPVTMDPGSVLADLLADWVTKAGLCGRLAALDVPRDDLPSLAEAAAEQWTGTFNPRKVGKEELLGLYQAAY